MGKTFGQYCGNKTGERLRVTGDKVELMFSSDDKVEQRGYYLIFALVSHGKWDHKKMIKFIKFTKFICLLKFRSFYFQDWRNRKHKYEKTGFAFKSYKKTFKRTWTCGVCSQGLANKESVTLFRPGLLTFKWSLLWPMGMGRRGRGFTEQHSLTLGVCKSLLTTNFGRFITHLKLFS